MTLAVPIQIDKGIPGLRLRHDRRGFRDDHERKPGSNLCAAERNGRILNAHDLRDRLTEPVDELFGQNRILRLLKARRLVHARRNLGTADVDDADAAVTFLIQEHERVCFLCAGIDDRRSCQKRMHRSGHDLFAEIRNGDIVHAEQMCERFVKQRPCLLGQRGRFRSLPFGRIDDHDLLFLRGFLCFRRRGRFRRCDRFRQEVRACRKQRQQRDDHKRPCKILFHLQIPFLFPFQYIIP